MGGVRTKGRLKKNRQAPGGERLPSHQKAIRRSEECACWLDCLWPMRKDESRLEAVPPVKTCGGKLSSWYYDGSMHPLVTKSRRVPTYRDISLQITLSRNLFAAK